MAKKYWLKSILAILLVTAVIAFINVNHGTKVQAAGNSCITKPTPIEKIFPDPALAEIIRSCLGKPSVEETVYRNELASITEINGDKKDIKSIQGMQYLSNLSKLSLIDNEVSNIESLKGLTKLRCLSLDNNEISDIAPLAGLTKLDILELGHNKISEISSLAKLTNIRWLVLSDNEISDIKVLAKLKELEALNLNNNKVSDLSPLSNLIILNWLFLGGNQLYDISPLKGLYNLVELDLTNQASSNNPVYYQKRLVISNKVKGVNGKLVHPATISDDGIYTKSFLTWKMPNYKPEVNYTFKQDVKLGAAKTIFSGKVTQPLNKPEEINNIPVVSYGHKKIASEKMPAPKPSKPTRLKKGLSLSKRNSEKQLTSHPAKLTNGNNYNFRIDDRNAGAKKAKTFEPFHMPNIQYNGTYYVVNESAFQCNFYYPAGNMEFINGELSKLCTRLGSLSQEKWSKEQQKEFTLLYFYNNVWMLQGTETSCPTMFLLNDPYGRKGNRGQSVIQIQVNLTVQLNV
ncbi:leucine-rich repeat domain-containing protein [Listeria ivanovii]|uniref:leucine-rich repeat domain-containing protein n=1 Tax=Listeria ivanovii TaxID=1638 RepID=UPI00190DC2A7|nr:leucine-rich repeat domain-containing protein [Listeria ivanovii]MBK3915256.1 hypothetical protein [Listeria ivanovii subsp. ivanovii]MBK3922384.1 hypothetical protein [Listeria ivanovii subsp. ivanovii]MBK3927544.1 hypothetical protein [Listeria ivanovii subsp. ivanovii]